MKSSVLSGHVGTSGIQSHSCGPHYPVVSYSGRRDGRPIMVATFEGVELVSDDHATHAADMDCMKYAEQISNAFWACRADWDGCTFYADRAGSPNSGYCVGLAGQETIVDRLPYDENDAYKDCRKSDYPTIFADVLGKLIRNGGTGSNNCIGCWVHGGRLYIDVSTVCDDYATAVELGRRNNQIAIYDLNQGTEITL